MSASHTTGLDQLAAEEIASIVVLLEAADRDLQCEGLTNRDGDARSLLELRIRLSSRLERWLTTFGATPASRLAWVDSAARADAVAGALRHELAEGARLVAEARDRAAVNGEGAEEDGSAS